MNTCGTCKHFGRVYELEWYDDEDNDGTVVFHVCDLLAHLNADRETKKAAALVSAGVIDGSGYHAAFCVKEEFGCIKWESRS